jgi:dihydrofolate reductase
MRRLVLFMHMSLDGFAAGPNGEMDWITVDEEIFDYGGRRIEKTDTALYGRVTYEMMQSYWPTAADQPGATRHDIDHAKWYNKAFKVVLSRSMKGQDLPNTRIISDDLENEINALKSEKGGEILIFGSPGAVHSLTKLDLIDDYWLFVNPILIGKGIPVFSDLADITKLKLLSNHAFSSGVVCLHHERQVG